MAATFNPERFGPYLLLSHLGRGGMADVYKARSEGVAGFSRHVVVKRILKVHTEEPHFVEMFINEAKIAARLSHPNIVQVYDLGEVEGELFMAMEYVRGQDLLRVMRAAAARGEPVPPPAIGAYIVREIARALSAAHEHIDEHGAPRPIIHRDVSPQNVMIGYDGQVKLVDFGIAKAVTAFQEVTHTGSLKGKFGYMAPEQIDTGVCTAQTDLFSAGVVLHEVLTGRRLFKGQTDYDTMTRVKTGPLLPPSSLAPQIDPTLDRIVMTALDRDPARRYQRASQLGRDLDEYLLSMRFSLDDLKAWLLRILPKTDRDEGESQVMQLAPSERGTPSRSGTPSRGGTPSRSRSGVTGSGALRSQATSMGDLNGPSWTGTGTGTGGPPGVEIIASQGSGAGREQPAAGRRSLVVVMVALAFALSLGGALLLLRPQQTASVGPLVVPGPGPGPGPGPPRPTVTPPGPAAGPGPTPGPGPAPVVPGPQARPHRLQLSSDPAGAVVYAGPRRLGITPLFIDLPEETMDIVLRLNGRPDLPYTLRRSEGEQVMLSLPEEEHRGRRRDRRKEKDREKDERQAAEPVQPGTKTDVTQPPSTPKPADPKGLRVKIVDEEERPSKIRAVDD